MPKERRDAVAAVAVGVWLILIGVGMQRIWHYKLAPGAVGALATSWPEASTLQRDTTRPTLLVFAHPRCACTRATLAELGRLLERVGAGLYATIVVVEPDGVAADWAGADWVPVVSDLPGVARVVDHGGREAARFGALTSGHALLFSTSGALLFSGGLTQARGHQGPAPGQQAIVDAIAGDDRSPRTASVFGCGLATTSAGADGSEHQHAHMEQRDE